MQKEITDVNQKLNKRGVYVEAMLWKEGFVLIYAYRRTHLARELQKDGVMELNANSADYGRYIVMNVKPESCLKRFRNVPEYIYRYLQKAEVFPR